MDMYNNTDTINATNTPNNENSKTHIMSMFDEIVESDDTSSNDSFIKELTKRQKKDARKQSRS